MELAIQVSKYILVRPRGGLNDCFNQIFKCLDYAERTGRVLLIDTTRSEGIRMDFSEVFCIYRSKAVIVGSLRDFPENIDRISTFPHQISGRVSSYNAIYGRDERNYVCSSTSTPVTFDFRREYGENLIVHEQCGGGLWGVELFSKIQAKNWLREEMIGKLELIKKYMPYIGVHLRFSDYKCDYGGFLSYLSQKVRGRNVLICSDSLDVRRDSVDILGGNNVFLSPMRLILGEPLYIVLLGVKAKLFRSTLFSEVFLICLGFLRLKF